MLGRPTSLRQRTALYILIPFFFLLITIEFISFRYIRTLLLNQMQTNGINHLERTANHIDTQLKLPKTLLTKLTEEPSEEIRSFLATTTRSLEGVIDLTLTKNTPSSDYMPTADNSTRSYYDPIFKNNTVILHVEATPQIDNPGYSAQLTISLYDLIGNIPLSPWSNNLSTFILDTNGSILSQVPLQSTTSSTSAHDELYISATDKQELRKLIAKKTAGIMPVGHGTTPDIIYGYHTLQQAPWTMVVFSDGASLSKPLYTFRRAFLFSSLFVTAIILFLLNLLVNRITRTAKKLSKAAGRLANGHFDAPLQLDRNDEIGMLVESFNAMSKQLQKGVKLQKSMTLAGEIQQRLLPQSEYKSEKFEAFGLSLPCDETGGDFFDIIACNSGKLFLLVGDVVGHGVGAALHMATTRALIRSEIEHAKNLSSCIGRVNRLLSRDTVSTGDFATLFLLSLDRSNRSIRWVRAGHEPAMLYNLENGSFTELKGKGLALGIDPTSNYQEQELEIPAGNHLILIGSDGLTDVENQNGERFGRLRLQQLIKKIATLTADTILKEISSEINRFSEQKAPDDDITVVIVKIR